MTRTMWLNFVQHEDWTEKRICSPSPSTTTRPQGSAQKKTRSLFRTSVPTQISGLSLLLERNYQHEELISCLLYLSFVQLFSGLSFRSSPRSVSPSVPVPTRSLILMLQVCIATFRHVSYFFFFYVKRPFGMLAIKTNQCIYYIYLILLYKGLNLMSFRWTKGFTMNSVKPLWVSPKIIKDFYF